MFISRDDFTSEEKVIINDAFELYIKALTMLDEDNLVKINKAYELMNMLQK